MSTHRRTPEKNLEKSDRRIYHIASATTVLIAICAAILSYSALRELAMHSGINGTLAYLFPLILDGLILIGALMVLFAATRGRRSWGGVFLTGLGVVSSIAGNVAVSPETMTARLVHAAAPVVLFLSIEAVTSLIRKMRNETAETLQMATDTAVLDRVVDNTPTLATTFFGQNAEVDKPSREVRDPVPTPEPVVANAVTPVAAPEPEVPAVEPETALVSQEVTTAKVSDPDPQPVKSPEIPEPKAHAEAPKVETPVQRDFSSIATVDLKPNMTARQKVVAYIEAGYHDVTDIADQLGGDRKYIRKLAREELSSRGLEIR